VKVAVLGGGFAGVLTARTLHARGYDVHVFEAAERIGGLCRSDVIDGFVYDVAGGHILHSRDREVLAEMLATLEEPVERQRDTKIYYHGRYVKYPFENGLGDLPRQDAYECLKGYVDAHVARRCGAPEPADFRNWIGWRFGEGMARHFMLPYNEKIWCVDLATVSSEWCHGRVPEAPVDDVIRGALGLGSDGYTHQLTFYYPRTGGFETLVHAFARGIEPRIRTSTPVRELDVGDRGFRVNGEAFDRVVNTLPLRCLFDALRPKPPADVLAALGGLRHLSLSTVFVALDGAEELAPHTWVYLPHPENGPMNRITYAHRYSPENAPSGCASVLAEITSVGGEGAPDLAALERTVVDKLVELGLLKPERVRFTRSHFNEYAYIVYDLGFHERIDKVLGWLESRNIPSLGRFARYSYVNTDQVYAMVRDALAHDFTPLA
jgi:protoporphyrinogen oxidase